MLIEYFKQYMKVTRGITDKSVGHYITGINSINTLLQKYDFPIKNVFQITSIHELDAVKAFLEGNAEFQQKDSTGHHMYSVAFKHFYRFACEDNSFFSNSISTMDIVIAKPKTVTTSSTQWRRNQIIITQVIEGAQYQCEHDPAHMTFIARSTGRAYMEGHHLLPLKHQSQFDCSIDIYANVVCLCPICHRLLHFGQDSDRRYAAEKLFEKRSDRLIRSGIDLSKNDFLELVLI
jgi:5-methylcytosine-specific restriction protein A